MDNLKRYSLSSISNFSITKSASCNENLFLPNILFVDDRTIEISRDAIFFIVLHYTNADKEIVLSKSRKDMVVFIRQLTMALIYVMVPNTLESIGSYFNKDHSTVLHALKVIGNYIITNDERKTIFINKIINKLERNYKYENIRNSIVEIAKRYH